LRLNFQKKKLPSSLDFLKKICHNLLRKDSENKRRLGKIAKAKEAYHLQKTPKEFGGFLLMSPPQFMAGELILRSPSALFYKVH
jgi:hypothetical protein